MKKIMLLGDSIVYGANGVHGYGYYVKKKLEGRADVFLPTDNCQDIRYLCSFVDELIPADAGQFDMIHWNSGLWDILHFLGNPNPHTSIEVYERTIIEFYDKLARMYPDASIFFATSTPIPERPREGSSYRRNDEVIAYNAAACKALTGKVKAIDDLYSAALPLGDACRAKDGLHYSEEGSAVLADFVCAFLTAQEKTLLDE